MIFSVFAYSISNIWKQKSSWEEVVYLNTVLRILFSFTLIWETSTAVLEIPITKF